MLPLLRTHTEQLKWASKSIVPPLPFLFSFFPLLIYVKMGGQPPLSWEARQARPKQSLPPVKVNGYRTDRVVLAHVL